MAMIDYGSVVKKNDKIIQNEAFMNMKQAVGFIIDKAWSSQEDEYKQIKDNFFSYMGDKDLLICVYKEQLWFIQDAKVKKIIWYGTEDGYVKCPYKKQMLYFTINNVNFHIKRLYNQNRYILRFWYKGDLYECLYGYGVDVNKDIWYDVKPNERRFIDNWFNNKKQHKYWRNENVNRNKKRARLV